MTFVMKRGKGGGERREGGSGSEKRREEGELSLRGQIKRNSEQTLEMKDSGGGAQMEEGRLRRQVIEAACRKVGWDGSERRGMDEVSGDQRAGREEVEVIGRVEG